MGVTDQIQDAAPAAWFNLHVAVAALVHADVHAFLAGASLAYKIESWYLQVHPQNC